jgi:hypothetical protein
VHLVTHAPAQQTVKCCRLGTTRRTCGTQSVGRRTVLAVEKQTGTVLVRTVPLRQDRYPYCDTGAVDMGDLLSDFEMKRIVPLLKKAMKERGLNAVKLVKLAGYSEKTIRDVVNYGSGMPKKTVTDICAAAGIKAAELKLPDDVDTDERRSIECGGYSKHSHGHYVGQYTTLRVAYANPTAVKCYRTNITWDDELSRLRFEEVERGDEYGQNGHIYIFPGSAYLSFLTVNKGWTRAILVSHLLHHNKIMRGLILSQYRVSGASYAPICAPIVYLRQSGGGVAPRYGEIHSGSEHYARYMGLLHETLNGSFAKLVHPTPGQPNIDLEAEEKTG